MAPNELTRWALVEDHDLLDVYRGRTIITGSPHLDTSLTMTAQDRKALRGRLGLAEGDDRRLVLFAPTWRGGVSKRELDREALVATWPLWPRVTTCSWSTAPTVCPRSCWPASICR